MKSFDCEDQLITYERPDANDNITIVETTAEIWRGSLLAKIEEYITVRQQYFDAIKELNTSKAGSAPVPSGAFPQPLGTVQIETDATTILKYLKDTCQARNVQNEIQDRINRYSDRMVVLAKQVAIIGNLRDVDTSIQQPTYLVLIGSQAYEVLINADLTITVTEVDLPPGHGIPTTPN